MRTSFSYLTLIVCGLWGASQAMADVCPPATASTINLVANCGFESGNFNNWTIGGLTLNPSGNYYGVDAFDAHSGSDGAYMSQDFLDEGVGAVTLSQTLTTLPGVSYQVTFWLDQNTAPTTGYIHAVSASWGGTNLFSLTPTITSPGPVGSFTEYTFVGTATGSATTLLFSFENDDSYWSFDDVSAVRTPEPSGGFLAGTGLGALFLLWSRRRLMRSKARA